MPVNSHAALATLPLGFISLIVALGVLVLAEWGRPARPPARGRWPFNIGFGLLNLLLVRLLAVIGPVALAGLAARHDFGLFNQISLAPIVTTLLVIVLMDFAIYWQHRASHRFGWFWAMHQFHHADPDFDVTTGLRFHPGEALLSMLYKGAVGMLLGAPPEAMLLFEVYLSIGSMFEHGNIHVPRRIDDAIRTLWVTPATHIIHHSAAGDDHNHNYGFAIAIWDRLFGTYRAEGDLSRIGLPQG